MINVELDIDPNRCDLREAMSEVVDHVMSIGHRGLRKAKVPDLNRRRAWFNSPRLMAAKMMVYVARGGVDTREVTNGIRVVV